MGSGVDGCYLLGFWSWVCVLGLMLVCIDDCCCWCEWFCCSYTSGFTVGGD